MADAIATMTKDELKQLILDLMEEHRLQHKFIERDGEENELVIEDESDNRTLQEVFASIERNRWTPPPGAPSPSQMIREERDNR